MRQSHDEALAVVASVRAALTEQETELERLQQEELTLRKDAAAHAQAHAKLKGELQSAYAGAARHEVSKIARSAIHDRTNMLEQERELLEVLTSVTHCCTAKYRAVSAE